MAGSGSGLAVVIRLKNAIIRVRALAPIVLKKTKICVHQIQKCGRVSALVNHLNPKARMKSGHLGCADWLRWASRFFVTLGLGARGPVLASPNPAFLYRNAPSNRGQCISPSYHLELAFSFSCSMTRMS